MTLDEWRDAGNHFSFHGHPIFYASEGQGDVLLLIHGFPTASWDWHRVWPELAGRFRLVAPDMMGFGFSAKPLDHDYSIREQADLHEQLCELLRITRVHVLAHDYGDTVAQELLARANEGSTRLEIRSVCLLNGGLFPEVHRALLTQRLLAGPLGPLLGRLTRERMFGRGLARVFGARTKPSPELLHDLWRLVSHEDGQRVLPELLGYLEERRARRERWVEALQQTTIPLRFVNGLLDPVSGAHMLTRWRALVRTASADWTEIPDVGHYPQVEDPEAVLAAHRHFLRRHGLDP